MPSIGSKTSKVSGTRTGVVSYLAYLHGGHNAAPGSLGRLGMQVDTQDDEAVARYFYKAITEDAQKDLKGEIIKLKAQIYDLQNKK